MEKVLKNEQKVVFLFYSNLLIILWYHALFVPILFQIN